MIKPITPKEAGLKKLNDVPDKVVNVWNNLIVKNLKGKTAVIKQNEAIAAIQEVTGDHRDYILEQGYLDIENLYRSAGWGVVYDKGAYYDDYEPYFTFTRNVGV